MSNKEIADEMYGNKNCLYGSAVFDGMFYKYEAYAKIRPEILVLGSSRVLQLKPQFFKDNSYYNIGQSTPYIAKLEFLADHIIETHPPKIIILGIDPWWFNAKTKGSLLSKEDIKRVENTLGAKHLTLPFKWLAEGKVTIGEYSTLPYSHRDKCIIGVKAIKQKAGYSEVGDYIYAERVYVNDAKYYDYKFKNTIKRIEKSGTMFEHNDQASEELIGRFVDLVDKLEHNGSKVILFYPPLANTATSAMKGKEYGYIKDMKEQLKLKGLRVYDYLNADNIGLNDCEFVDGYHPGDVAQARVLLDMAKKGPKLKNVVDTVYLKEIIDKYSGLAMIPDPKITKGPEVDFLGIGCKKN